MAKFSVHGTKVDTFHSDSGTQYTLMSDGTIMRQYRTDKLEAPTILRNREGKKYQDWTGLKGKLDCN